MKIETILSPAELPALARRDLRQTACVVFDILRATSTFVTALHLGAKRSGTGVPPACFYRVLLALKLTGGTPVPLLTPRLK